jgi:hypothetical protein
MNSQVTYSASGICILSESEPKISIVFEEYALTRSVILVQVPIHPRYELPRLFDNGDLCGFCDVSAC